MYTPAWFVFESERAGELINKLTQAGYPPFYNTTNGKDYYWFQKNFSTSVHRAYNVTKVNSIYKDYDSPLVDELISYNVDELEEDMRFTPDILIVYGPDVELNEYDWDCIQQKIHCILFRNANTGDQMGGDQLMHKRCEKIMCKPIVQRVDTKPVDGEYVNLFGVEGILTSIKPEYPKLDKPYSIRQHYIQPIKKEDIIVVPDIMIYEVTRPNTILPFTVVIKDFATHGIQRLFTDLYGSEDWDVNRTTSLFDFSFLQKLWRNLNLPGEFNTYLVKDRVDRTYPGRCICSPVETRNKDTVCPNPDPRNPDHCMNRAPDREPTIYRRSLEHVVAVIQHNQIDRSELPDRLIKRRKTTQ
jgi:hypothetical protein